MICILDFYFWKTTPQYLGSLQTTAYEFLAAYGHSRTTLYSGPTVCGQA